MFKKCFKGWGLKAYSNIIKNNFSNIFSLRTYPRFAHIFVTWKCNLRCQDCTIWQRFRAEELDTAGFIKMIKKLPFLDIVKISGGEPFIREDLSIIVNEVKKNISPYIIQVTTNGTYPERIIEFVKQTCSPSLHLRISLDGLGEVYERIRRGASYRKVLATILTLVDLRKRYPFHMGINYGLRNETLPFLEEILEFCNKNKIGLIMGYPIKPFLRDADFDSNGVGLDIPKDVHKAYIRFIHRQKAGTNFLESVFNNLINKISLRTEAKNSFKFNCGELRDLIYILPNADLVVCGLRQKKVANLLAEDFRDIWFSKKIEKYKREIRNCPGCLQKSIKLVSKIYKIF